MTIIFVRHGETALNAARTLQPASTPLGPRGLLQAAAAARRLALEGLGAVLSSDLPRALQTAEAIAAASSVTLQTTALLQERNFGELRGRPYDSLDFDPLAMLEAPPGGESMATFLQRVAEAFAFAVRLRAQMAAPLAVVSHGLVIRALLGVQVPLAPGQALPVRIGNTALTIVDALPPYRALRVNCVTHLDAERAEDGSSLSGG